MNKDNTKDKIDFAKYILEHSISLINLADTKAGILLGINGIMLALMFGIEKENLAHAVKIFFFLTSVTLGLSSAFAIFTLIPRFLKNSKKSIIYFEKIAEDSEEEYIKTWEALPDKQILEDCILNNYKLAKILSKKYYMLRCSIVSNIIGIGSLVIAVCSFLIY